MNDFDCFKCPKCKSDNTDAFWWEGLEVWYCCFDCGFEWKPLGKGIK